MRKKILLINPPFEKLKGFSIESMPLGLLYLGSVLNENGYDVKVYDADTTFKKSNLRKDISGRPQTQKNYVDGVSNESLEVWRELKNVLKKYQPDVIGVSVKTPVYHSCLKTLSIVREILPQSVICVGGPHITITGDNMLQYNEVDYSFYGESEYSFLEFVKSLSQGKDVLSTKGLIYRRENNVVKNEPAGRVENLDDLPFPDKSLLWDNDKYRFKLGALITSRGCPFKCAFCATIPLWGKRVLFRSPENILDEIDHLHDRYKIRNLEILDDTFTLKKDSIIKFCKGLIERYGKQYFKWVCLTNINVLDKELLSYMKDAGCIKVNIGIESGSDRILKMIHKNITVERVRQVVKLIKRSGIQVHGYFMLGVPYETEEDMKNTVRFIKELKPDSVNLCTFTPYPGTELYDFTIKEGLFDPGSGYEIYKTICTHSDQNYFLTSVKREVYLKYLNQALTIVGKINKRTTIRKLRARYGYITVGRIKNKVRKELKKRFSNNGNGV